MIGLVALMAACSPIVDNRGYTTETVDFKQIIQGQSTQDDVRAVLGSPSSMSSFGDPIWYYITVRKETAGMLATKITGQHVYAITFDEKHVVSKIDEYTIQDGKQVTAVSKKTPTEGNTLTFQQQIFGNFGRFSTPGREIDPKGLGR
jgi:outer membrane protein assembly factor BamE (lipoprotein component of BamABCDE complex)